jgi:hypothetical protein
MNIIYRAAALGALVLGAAVAQPASARCLTRTIPGARGPASIMIVVPASGAHAPAAPGYSEVSCGDFDKVQYREFVCTRAIDRTSPGNRSIEILAGTSLGQLCAAAQAEAGLPDTVPAQPKPPRGNSRLPPPDPSAPLVGRLAPDRGGQGN